MGGWIVGTIQRPRFAGSNYF